MAVRSAVLVGPHSIPANTTYTPAVAPDRTWIVRTVVLVNVHAVPIAYSIGMGGFAEGQLVVAGLTVPANGRRVHEEWWVWPANTAFVVQNLSLVQPVTLTVFGADLFGTSS